MSSLLTPSHEIALDVYLILVLLGLSPAMFASWLQSRFPRIGNRLPADWYSLVLFTIAVSGYVTLGAPPALLAASPFWTSLLLGVLLGGCAIGIELVILKVGRQLLKTGRGLQRERRDKRLLTPVPYVDIPTEEGVVWRLYGHSPAWRSGLSNLLIAAVLEECIYRQTLLALLAPVLGISLAALASTFGFGLIHLYFGFSSVISKWIIGAIFTLTILTGVGLLATITAHCILNGAAFFERNRASREGTVRFAGIRI